MTVESEVLLRLNIAGGTAFTVKFEGIASVTRVLFVTPEGVSRHEDLDNLKDCLKGKLRFDRDAIFFRGDKAVRELRHLTKAAGVTDAELEVLKSYETAFTS